MFAFGYVFSNTGGLTGERHMAKKTKKRKIKRVAWTKALEKELRAYSKQKLPVAKISKMMKRTPGALRQKARGMGLALGHRR
jgi:hypothetical protein